MGRSKKATAAVQEEPLTKRRKCKPTQKATFIDSDGEESPDEDVEEQKDDIDIE
jgi:hypothetical protein